MIGTRERWAPSRLATSKPSMSGSITSRRIRCGRKSDTAASAWAPVPADSTSKPWKRSAMLITSTMFGSSSTTRTRCWSVAEAVTDGVSAAFLGVVWEKCERFVCRAPAARLGSVATVRRLGWTLAVTYALVGAAPASAAYAPQLSFSLNPSTARTPAAISSTVTEAAGETPSKTVTVTLPPGFTANTGNQLAACPATPCPAESQMGQASATVDVFGLTRMLSGPVYFGGPAGAPGSFALIVALVDPALGPQTLNGVSSLRPDGSIDTVFDNLPNFLATAFTLA